MAGHVANVPDQIALVEDGASWSYRELDRRVTEIAAVLSSLGVRAGDRMIIVSENGIALAGLLLATSRLDAWAIVANPRLSARELDQIRDHSGARRMFFSASLSKEAAAHASRLGAEIRHLGPLRDIGVGQDAALDIGKRPRGTGGVRPCKASRGVDLHLGNDGNAEGSDALPRQPADQRKDHGAHPQDGSGRQDLSGVADLAYCRRLAPDHDVDGRRYGADGE